MKRFGRYLLLTFFFVSFCFFLPKEGRAQIGIDCDYQDPDFPCPIDGGVYFLVAIGVLYGVKKVKDQAKEPAKNKN